MSDLVKSGSFVIFAIIIPIVAWLGTGYIAWNWVNPKSLWGIIKFLFTWGALGYTAKILCGLIYGAITILIEKLYGENN